MRPEGEGPSAFFIGEAGNSVVISDPVGDRTRLAWSADSAPTTEPALSSLIKIIRTVRKYSTYAFCVIDKRFVLFVLYIVAFFYRFGQSLQI
jgi:hypothetical protein